MPADDVPPKEKLSKTPSWVMVGFAAGVLVVLAVQNELDRRQRESEPPKVRKTQPEKVPASNIMTLKDRPSLMAVEAVFEQEADQAVWENDLTEIAVWNEATARYSDCFEVARYLGSYYFRSISRLTRPLIDEPVGPNTLIVFTEPESRRKERLAREHAGGLKPSQLMDTTVPRVPIVPPKEGD